MLQKRKCSSGEERARLGPLNTRRLPPLEAEVNDAESSPLRREQISLRCDTGGVSPPSSAVPLATSSLTAPPFRSVTRKPTECPRRSITYTWTRSRSPLLRDAGSEPIV
ncbi:hypothetical protein EYF80_031319 [Liparis tanakae]|uniref:Uncharacterized protein n=1 Tax=Liparis tanakae TaxID=230148 RepID=A0A4Z2GYB5_9TELE|nr:hypothetical protein EYF80_031319 [Liparis tanakae]